MSSEEIFWAALVLVLTYIWLISLMVSIKDLKKDIRLDREFGDRDREWDEYEIVLYLNEARHRVGLGPLEKTQPKDPYGVYSLVIPRFQKQYKREDIEKLAWRAEDV